MLHRMRLQDEPFFMIKSGKKDILKQYLEDSGRIKKKPQPAQTGATTPTEPAVETPNNEEK